MSSKENEKVQFYLDHIISTISMGALILQVKHLAIIKGQSQQVVRNDISSKKFPIPSFLDGGRRCATALSAAIWLAKQDTPPPPKPPRGRPTKAALLAKKGGV